VWAGVGWITAPITGRGLIVEHEGGDEHTVRDQIATNLDDLRRHGDIEFHSRAAVSSEPRALPSPHARW
jgi:hypothetical protein